MNVFNKSKTEPNNGKDKQELGLEPEYPGRAMKEYHSFYCDMMGEDPEYTVRVYRVPKHPKAGLEFLDKYIDCVPDEAELGLEHGSCQLRCHGKKPGQVEPDVRIINLPAIWDKRKREHDLKKAGNSQNNNDLEQSLIIMERLAGIMDKFGNNGNGKIGASRPLTGALREIENMQVDLVKSSIKERASLLTEFKQIQAENAAPVPLVDDGAASESLWDHPFVNETMEAIMEHGRAWLGAKPATKEKYAQSFNNNEAFKGILKDENLVLALYNKGCSMDKAGKNLMDDLFHEVGINVETKEPQETGKQ